MKIYVRYLLISLASLLVACDKPVIISPDAILPNGAVYEGDIENGKFNGAGKLVYPSETYYEGQFKDDLFNGIGTLVDSDGKNMRVSLRTVSIMAKGYSHLLQEDTTRV